MSAIYQTPSFPSSLSAPGPVAPASAVPSGTFLPGTKVQVGQHRVVIEKYLSEGGFAHVYVVRPPKPIDGRETAVLKRVAVPDKETLATMRTEVETMKKLKGRRHIVTYVDSHASQLKGGGYEVFLLMEYCNGGGLIDFMNTRLQNRLKEPEILKIFSDVAQGVACMHYLKPPLMHRDLKVENVLITKDGSSTLYKLCDFGSTAPPRPAATSAAEGRLIEEDVQKHTTLQYRSPEMIDVYRKQPIDEKSDIWALGVLLYKLCYYKTPFEEQGQMAILNASFKYPGYPSFSDRLKKLIALMLRENPQHRPNIYQVLREIAALRGTDTPIKDIYSGRTQSEDRRNQQLPSKESQGTSLPVIGAVQAAPQQEKTVIPEITPMRRGRPTKAGDSIKVAKPSPSPLRHDTNDPFTALDSKTVASSDSNLDDVSTRFPALDDFSLLHEKGNRFSFDQEAGATADPKKDIKQRVTEALADDAFANAKAPNAPPPSQGASSLHLPTSRPLSIPTSNSRAQSKPTSRSTSGDRQEAQKSPMVSTGTMTSPPPSPPSQPQSVSNRTIYRFPPSNPASRSSSQPRNSNLDEGHSSAVHPDANLGRGLSDHRPKSQILLNDKRTSFEVNKRPSNISSPDDGVHRSKSASSKTRPSSMQSSKPSLLRRMSRDRPQHVADAEENVRLVSGVTDEAKDDKINSNVEYLKAVEVEDASKKKEKRLSSGSKHIKRANLPSVSLSGTKNLLAGRFGEAFRKFETNNGPQDVPLLDSPTRPNELTPIAGSEATDGRSDDGRVEEETEEVSPEVRRELERRRLSEEERRVTDGAAAYKLRVAGGGEIRPSGKAASIQSKVKTLLDESGRASPSPTKAPPGFGRHAPSLDTRPQTSGDLPPRSSSIQPSSLTALPGSNLSTSRTDPRVDPRPQKPPNFNPPRLSTAATAPPSTNIPASAPQSQVGGPSLTSRPSGPPKPKPQPKPQALRTGDRPPQSPAKPKPSSLASRKPLATSSAQPPPPSTQSQPSTTAYDGAPDDDWETNFSKRYPDLSGLEMVETEIDQGGVASGGGGTPNTLGREMRVREV
ncbi:uncharacterized protein KY384_000885 [Bacidia gigantensis]|uniref:uncharacterized protein n=1 Tax=Bacidia gigantensis TaxID=2732470 RepID=UPI001D0516DB|nr:uncharacterized protein KY384_000885 [Bacidia gigantensis]KAG8534042.1 hypothetical protein KY384_000885 [Bacidia gigantensis]